MSSAATSMQALRERRKSEGLCIRCGEPPRPSRSECRKCSAAQQKRQQAYRERRRLRAAGMTPNG